MDIASEIILRQCPFCLLVSSSELTFDICLLSSRKYLLGPRKSNQYPYMRGAQEYIFNKIESLLFL